MLWQVVQATLFTAFAALCVPRLWRPKASLYWAMVATEAATPWQVRHWVLLLMAPACQLGVVWPPWQLTFAQVREAEVKAEAPVLAL
jgi:hypothetical protein